MQLQCTVLNTGESYWLPDVSLEWDLEGFCAHVIVSMAEVNTSWEIERIYANKVRLNDESMAALAAQDVGIGEGTEVFVVLREDAPAPVSDLERAWVSAFRERLLPVPAFPQQSTLGPPWPGADAPWGGWPTGGNWEEVMKNVMQGVGESSEQPSVGGLPGMGAFAGAAGKVPDAASGAQPSPEMLQGLMGVLGKSPAMMELLTSDAVIDSLLKSPQAEALLKDRPELRHMMRDKSMWREMMTAARDPTLWHEMVKNQDRALANISMMPGGDHMIQNAYKSIINPESQEPTEEAPEPKEDTEQDNFQPLSNPWG